MRPVLVKGTLKQRGREMATAELELDVCMVDELIRKYRSVRVSIERITPDIARSYLKMNTRNRRLNERHAEVLAGVMSAGDWWMNGESIIFGADEVLLNGQHRLWAVIRSGTTVDALVVRGVDEGAFRTMDGGKVRTAGDVLSMEGEKDANRVCATVQALLAFVDYGGNVTGSTSAARKATPLLSSRVLSAYPQIRDSANAMRRNPLYRNQYGCMLHFLFSLSDALVADDFADVLADCDSDLERPFMIFREHLIANPCRPDLRRSHAAKAIKAFNAEVSGERPKMFKLLKNEDFPAITGLDYDKLAESIV